jgi:hypothetical protein
LPHSAAARLVAITALDALEPADLGTIERGD